MNTRYIEKLDTLPEHMRETIQAWIETGRPTGDFMRALLSNDLMGAYSHADADNAAAMKQWVMYLYNYAPCGCFGSPEAVKDWAKQGGLRGLEAA